MDLDKRDSPLYGARIDYSRALPAHQEEVDLSDTTAPTTSQGRRRNPLIALWVGMTFLIFMNLAGMYLNLWGNIPNYSSPAKAFGSVPLLDAHVAIAIGILINISMTVIATLRPENKALRPIAPIAVAFAALAVFSGVEFTFGGGNDIFSMTMEIGFAGLITATAYVLFVVGRRMRTPIQ